MQRNPRTRCFPRPLFGTASAFFAALVAGGACQDVVAPPISPEESENGQAVAVQSSEVDRATLTALYHATDGPNWAVRDHNWATDAPLDQWRGVKLDENGRVRYLDLNFVSLLGTLPPEIGKLDALKLLSLTGNFTLTNPLPSEFFDLTGLEHLYMAGTAMGGPMPPEIGRLENLQSLSMRLTGLGGPIPPEIGQLTRLQRLNLIQNDLIGAIPPEIGNLGELWELMLSDNDLTGPLPSEMGRLENLWALDLQQNKLDGHIPESFGGLAQLRTMELQGNRLTGPVPSTFGQLKKTYGLYLQDNALSGDLPVELGGMSSLQELYAGANAALSGHLPREWSALSDLRQLKLGGTEVCAPDDPELHEWLGTIKFHRVARCATGDAYIVQAVQSHQFPVALVEGRDALLRVFLSSPNAGGATMPPVRATFYHDGAVAATVDLPASDRPIPESVNEGELESTLNLPVAGALIREGLEYVVEVDPDGALDPGVGILQRIPATGRASVDVKAMPEFKLHLIPFAPEWDADSSVIRTVRGAAASPWEHPLLEHTRTLLPVGTMNVVAEPAVIVSGLEANGFRILQSTIVARAAAGGGGYWVGIGPSSGGLLGVAAAIPSFASFSVPSSFTLAHELGHNLGLWHAPCGGAGGPDPLFPEPHGRTGAWGFDAKNNELVSPYVPDLMSYCGRAWIGDYHFSNAMRHRLIEESRSARQEPRVETLLVWGGMDGDGQLALRPSFYMKASPQRLPAGSKYRIVGWTATGEEAFAVAFDMPQVQDSKDGQTGFVALLPVTWEGELVRIRLIGPEGHAVLDESSDLPMTILLDPETGKIRGVLDQPPAAAMDAAGDPELKAVFSRGIPLRSTGS